MYRGWRGSHTSLETTYYYDTITPCHVLNSRVSSGAEGSEREGVLQYDSSRYGSSGMCCLLFTHRVFSLGARGRRKCVWHCSLLRVSC